MKLKIKEMCESVSITHKFDTEKLYFLNTGDIFNGKITNHVLYNINELKGQAKKTIKNGDILFSEIRPKNKHFAMVELKNPDEYVVSTKLMVLRKINNDVDLKYLYYLLINESFLNILQMRAENRICSFPQITFDVLGEYEFDVPDIDTQRKIANILTNLDNQIQRNNDMVYKLQVLVQATYDRWFNQFEFPNKKGLSYKSNGGKMVWNKELKKEIPENWEVKQLKELLVESKKSKIQVGVAKETSGEYPFFTSGEEILLYKDYLVDGPHCYLNTGGNADVKFYDGKASYSTDTWCISFGEYTYIINEYLQIIKPQMDRLFFSGSGLQHLQKESFKQLNILVPDYEIVKKYNDIASHCYKQVTDIYLENNRLHSLKNTLLPLLMNGQVVFDNND